MNIIIIIHSKEWLMCANSKLHSLSFQIKIVHRLLSCSLLHLNVYAPKPSIQYLWKSLELSMKNNECNCQKTYLCSCISWPLLAFNHSATQWPHAAMVHFLIWLFPAKCISPFHNHPFIPPLDIRSSLAQCGKLFDWDTKLSSSSIP